MNNNYGQGYPSSPLWGSRIIKFSAPLFILCTPFVKFITVRGYGFSHLEIAYIFGLISLAAIVITVFISLRPKTLAPVLLATLILGVFSTEILQLILFVRPYITLPFFSPKIILLILVLPFFLVAYFLAWILRTHLEKLILTTFGVIMISTFIMLGDTKPLMQFDLQTPIDRQTSSILNKPPSLPGPPIFMADT